MSTVIWWLDALKRTEKIIRENAFEQKRKKPGLEFNLGLALIGLWTTCRAMNIWVSWLISSGSPLSVRHTIQRYNDHPSLSENINYKAEMKRKANINSVYYLFCFRNSTSGKAEILPRAEGQFENECFFRSRATNADKLRNKPREIPGFKKWLE